MKYPNQRVITSNKTKVETNTGKERPYLLAYVDIIEQASRQLSGNAFKLYIYLLTNNRYFQFGFSPKDIANRYGCSTDTIRDAFVTLVNKGFLTLENGSKTKYIFTDIATTPPVELPNTVRNNIEKRVFRDSETGIIYNWTFKELLSACNDNENLAKELWEGAN